MSLTTIGMWENRKRKNLSLWQIGCTMCTTGIPDLLAAKGLKLMIEWQVCLDPDLTTPLV